MDFKFSTPQAARSAAIVLQTQAEQLLDKKIKITARADGSRVIIDFPHLSPQKKKVADYTAKRLAELMRNLERA